MSKEYFDCVGVLLGIYGILRVFIALDRRNYQRLIEASKKSDIPSHPIDTSPLAHRLEEVRQDYAAEAHAHPASAKTPLLVEQRRAEMAKLAFFQKLPPAPEPPEQQPRLMLLAL